MKRKLTAVALLLGAISMSCLYAKDVANYKIVDSGQTKFFDATEEIERPEEGEPFYGQDAHFVGNVASYTDNGDGTVTDNVTGLVWQKGYKVMSYADAMKAASKFKLAGYKDWRVPTIEEAYSLMLFSGTDVNPMLSAGSDAPGTPFIDINYFDFKYAANGNRAIDSQMLSSTRYVGSTESENLVFGVNFADGRIKGYGMTLGQSDKKFMVRFVRGAKYGENDFVDNGDGTISDIATSLMWSKEDSQKGMNWESALQYAQDLNEQNYLGYSDWRVPSAKELQSIVDYTRSPFSSGSAAINPLFKISVIKAENGEGDYPFFWSSTTHENSGTTQGGAGVYVAFGRSLGNMSNSQGMGQQRSGGQGQGMGQSQGGGQRPGGQGMSGGQGMGQGGGQRPGGQGMSGGQRPGGQGQSGQSMSQQGQRQRSQGPNWVDIHGAGSQRSDPKDGDPTIYANGHGPQGDAVRIMNYVRVVRSID
ncbi:MAG: DUF1566 domain-containing protein [Rikenellaceae bacterium]